MNLLLLEASELSAGQVQLEGRRARHILEVLRPEVGGQLRAGLLNGPLGKAEVLVLDRAGEKVTLRCVFDEEAPARSEDTLLLAVPRPRVLRRCLFEAASLGIGKILLFRSWRVDKSHLGSKVLGKAVWKKELILGLEQALRTHVPTVQLFPLFKPFVEDQLERLLPDGPRFLAHPTADEEISQMVMPAGRPFTLAIGPEGGFIPYEVEALAQRGFKQVRHSPHPLRVESALTALYAQLSLLRQLQVRE